MTEQSEGTSPLQAMVGPSLAAANGCGLLPLNARNCPANRRPLAATGPKQHAPIETDTCPLNRHALFDLTNLPFHRPAPLAAPGLADPARVYTAFKFLHLPDEPPCFQSGSAFS